MPLSFPSSPTQGQQATTGGRTYQWTGEAWQLVGSGILGPTGPSGPAGSAGAASTVTGPTGAVGPAGSSGAAGSTGPTGAAGAASTVTGPTGSAGSTGPTGPAGTGGGGSFSWATAPAESTSTGTAGDLAYDANRLYVCTSANTWRAAALTRWDGDPYWSSVSLLMRMEGSGAAFADLSSNAFSVTAVGDATQSTTQAKFGSKSAAFTDGQISLPSNAAFNFGAGDFCIEFWVYFNSTASDQRVASGDNATGSSGNFNWGIYTPSTGTLALYMSSSGYTWDIASGNAIGTFSTGQWYHVAIARSAGAVRSYFNGTLGATITTGASLFTNPTNGPHFGRVGTSSKFDGYIDEIRITKGNDRGYTGASITVPTAPFPDY